MGNEKNCGGEKNEEGKDKKRVRVPTTHALGPSLSLRLVKGWVTLYPESGPMKRERYTCTNTSTRRIVRDAVSSLRVCSCSYNGVQRVNIFTRGEKTGWRPCLVATRDVWEEEPLSLPRARTFCSIEWPRFRDAFPTRPGCRRD